MSHISEIKNIVISDLTALEKACEALDAGVTFHEGVTLFKSYGGSRNKCDHKITVKGSQFEIGVVEKRDGSYGLQWDTYGDQGRKLVSAIGNGAEKLNQQYAAEVAIGKLRRQGFRATKRTRSADGFIHLELTR